MRGLGFYLRLAGQGIVKNARVYLPYIITCLGMVMMYYIVGALESSKIVAEMRGGSTVQDVMSLGEMVIGFFSLLFLLYTNSFLLRRRKKEFGLYNILGMSKRNLAWVLLLENLMVAALALVGGLGLGIVFSKLAELSLSRLLAVGPDFGFEISTVAIISCLKLYGLIFLLLLLNSLRQVHMARPVDLLRAPNFGERPPRANWLFALLGLVLLGVAYWLAITIEDPIMALGLFFVAVILVIIATYLLFMAGSVAFCRLLQKNKKFYYQTRHFVATGNMLFRMRRNGAGLASICILSTMVLVMISTTGCLFWGKEDALLQRYPQEMIFSVKNIYDTDNPADPEFWAARQQSVAQYRLMIEQAMAERGWQAQNVLDFVHLDVAAFNQEGEFRFEPAVYDDESFLQSFSEITMLHFITLADYNNSMNMALELQPNEIFICEDLQHPYTLTNLYLPQASQLPEYQVKATLPAFPPTSISDSILGVQELWLVLPDMEALEEVYAAQAGVYQEGRSLVSWYYAFDLPEDVDPENSMEIVEQVWNQVDELKFAEREAEYPVNLSIGYNARESERVWFYSMNSGLFFLAIVLTIVFVTGALLIMYYKQLIEGYEDQAGFDILRKLGMTTREIRRSVNWQTLILFFLPLLVAGIHLVFAFPMLSQLIMLFGVMNIALLSKICVICYLVFAIFYILAYLVTARLYYRIVTA